MTFPNTFATKDQMANLAAKMFLEIEAVNFALTNLIHLLQALLHLYILIAEN